MASLLFSCLFSAVAAQVNYLDFPAWENNIVPYFFNENVTDNDRRLVREQMDTIQQNTCIMFEDFKNDSKLPSHHLVIQGNRSEDAEASCMKDGDLQCSCETGPDCPEDNPDPCDSQVIRITCHTQLADQKECQTDQTLKGRRAWG